MRVKANFVGLPKAAFAGVILSLGEDGIVVK
jgi:hypothetical protein